MFGLKGDLHIFKVISEEELFGQISDLHILLFMNNFFQGFKVELIEFFSNTKQLLFSADIYISKQMKNELYYEEYDNVAVMFATIKNYDIDNVGLRVLNEIICDFDEVVGTSGMLVISRLLIVILT